MNMNVTLKEAAALLHVRGEVCKALRSREWSWLELQALLKAESEAVEALRNALKEGDE